MNWSNVKLILWREIRDQLRDRRTLFMIAVLPVLLYPLLGMSFLQISQFMREHATKVLVIGAPEFAAVEVSAVDDSSADAAGAGQPWPPLFDQDRFDKNLFTNADNSRLLELVFGENRPGGMVDWSQADEAAKHTQAQRLMAQNDLQVVVYFPPDFGQRLEEFRRVLLEKDQPYQLELQEIPGPTIYYNTANEKSQITYNRVSKVLDRWAVEVGRQNLQESKVPILAARPFDYITQDVAAVGHRDAAMWSKIMPFVLLIWALTGAFYPAIDLCAGEKERGTLETLLSSPAERSEIVWGKLLTVMVFSMTTAILNLLCMGITSGFVVSQLNRLNMLGVSAPLSIPPATSLVWLLIALVPVSALFSALCLALASFARSTKEGQYYLMPLMLITMPLMMLPMAPGVELNLGNSLIPISGVVLLLRAMLEGNLAQAWPYIPPVAMVTLVCCLFAIRWAVDQFNKESVLFRESERLDLGLWARHLVKDRGPTPTVAGALSCFLLIMMIQFVMNLSLPAPEAGRFGDIALLIFISQVVVIAMPALLMTLFFTRSPRRTLLLQRPRLLALPLAVLLAVAVHPHAGLQLQQAAGVRGSDDLRARPVRVAHLLLKQRHRHLRVLHVVDAGAAAAMVGAGHLLQREPRYQREQLARG